MNTSTVNAWIDRSRAQLFFVIAIAAVVYYASARVGLQLAFENTNASPVWPPSGIAFAIMLLFGKRIWPGVFVGAFLANFIEFNELGFISTTTNFLTSFAIASGNTLEALTGYWLLLRLNKNTMFTANLRQMFYFVLIAVIMSFLGSVVGSSSIVISGLASADSLMVIWFTWWIGDTMGILVFTSLIISWLRPSLSSIDRNWWINFASIITANALIATFIFLEIIFPESVSSLPFLVGPLLLWAAYCCGLRGATVSILIVSTISVIGTINGYGAFAADSTHNPLLLLQLFIFVVTITTLTLAVAFEERSTLESELRNSNIILEKRITDRTNELANRNRELNEHHEKLEEIVAQRTYQLESSNKELESFSYSVSHDLRAPLRSIDGFCQIIAEEYADKLDEEGLEYFQRVRHASQRMGVLIDDILELSRVALVDLNLRTVNLSSMANEIIFELKEAEPERNVLVNIQGDIKVNADRQLLQLVMLNLIENAWKYTADRKLANISISSANCGSEIIISVKDNGVGFDMKYIDKLFKPFQRLHGPEFDGVGIGLATVKRIISRHGGRVWVNGGVNKGATFYFSLISNKNNR